MFPAILKSLNTDLRPRVEVAVEVQGALPVILTGDCISVLAAIAGTRRYYRNVSLIYVDRDADLNVPATTPSGCVDGMVISQVIGRGAPELVRFWGEAAMLVREPDIALFGFDRLDAPEEQYLVTVAAAARIRLRWKFPNCGSRCRCSSRARNNVHAANHEFVLHFDVDVINGEEEFPWTNLGRRGRPQCLTLKCAMRFAYCCQTAESGSLGSRRV